MSLSLGPAGVPAPCTHCPQPAQIACDDVAHHKTDHNTDKAEFVRTDCLGEAEDERKHEFESSKRFEWQRIESDERSVLEVRLLTDTRAQHSRCCIESVNFWCTEAPLFQISQELHACCECN